MVENKVLISGPGGLHAIVGVSGVMAILKDEIVNVGTKNFSVVITGETGTGKELFARNLHYHSPNRNKPFVDVNCAGISESLLEAELFGYDPHSFTGSSHQGKKGKLEQAHEGTLFLDEIGEMSPKCQGALLRAIQMKEIARVGGVGSVKTNFRLITATNINLENAVKMGEFREDLYHRIYEIDFHIPPLRERKEDIPVLLEYFAEIYGRETSKSALYFEPEAVTVLINYPWPGNVRELENFVKRCSVHVSGKYVGARDARRFLKRRNLTVSSGENGNGGLVKTVVKDLETREAVIDAALSLGISVEDFEEGLVTRAATLYGNKIEAARMIGMSKSSFYRRLEAIRIRKGIGDNGSSTT